jgi:glycosyltransferase involved in cell wall biosynthesis
MSAPRRILIATDAWRPQVNGVVRTLEMTIAELERLGHTVALLEPSRFPRLPVPFYREIELCWPSLRRVERVIRDFQPDTIHVSTEGPIGLAVRRYCVRRRRQYTTSYHTKFPEYMKHILGLPESWTYGYMRWFHKAAAAVMVATPSLREELRQRRFLRPMPSWSRGVDLSLFYPRPKTFPAEHRPIALYVGRVAWEKSVEDFLRLKLPGRKYVVGDGPIRPQLEKAYPETIFLGYLTGENLAAAYANADVFVFPSRTDTFGLVVVEALACGVPVAAYPAVGPKDIVTDPRAGAIDEDLGRAVERALKEGDPRVCVQVAQQYTWENCTRQFLANMVPAR